MRGRQGVPADQSPSGADAAPLSKSVTPPPPHPTRTRILEHLRALPGDSLRSVSRAVGESLGEVRYHLHVLGKAGLVRSEKVRFRKRYYPVHTGSEAERNELFQRYWHHRDLRSRVLQTVELEGPVRPAQLARTIGISRQLASYHLDRLAVSGRVARDGAAYRVPSGGPAEGATGVNFPGREGP